MACNYSACMCVTHWNKRILQMANKEKKPTEWSNMLLLAFPYPSKYQYRYVLAIMSKSNARMSIFQLEH